LSSQDKIDEPGAIYRCNLTSGSCSPYVLDPRGDVTNYVSECPTNNFENKGFQWLGGSMDGGTRDTDKLLVCAPRFYAISTGRYHMIGVCYWVQNTLKNTPEHVTRISPLRLKSKQVDNKDRGTLGRFIYQNGEMGLSAHVTDDNSRFLIGAPGIDNWRGSLILDFPEDNLSENHLTENDNYTKTCHLEHNKTRIPEPQNWNQEEDSYFGYAVSSGYFDSSNPKTLLYVATAPQANKPYGEAYIFDLNDNGTTIRNHTVFHGEKYGEYFGYSVLAEDLNGDGKTDVIISAPQHALEDSYDNGAIYVFINKGSVSNALGEFSYI